MGCTSIKAIQPTCRIYCIHGMVNIFIRGTRLTFPTYSTVGTENIFFKVTRIIYPRYSLHGTVDIFSRVILPISLQYSLHGMADTCIKEIRPTDRISSILSMVHSRQYCFALYEKIFKNMAPCPCSCFSGCWDVDRVEFIKEQLVIFRSTQT